MQKKIIYYNPCQKEKARELRNNCTQSEKYLWEELKGKQLRGFDFHRQKPIGEYIVDFFCPELMLAIEIDGDSHIGREAEDEERQMVIEGKGIKFLRFDDQEVKINLKAVLERIIKWIDENERKR